MATSSSEPTISKKRARQGTKVPRRARSSPLTVDNLALRLERMNKLVESTLSTSKTEKSSLSESPYARKLLPSIDDIKLQGVHKKSLKERLLKEVHEVRESVDPATMEGDLVCVFVLYLFLFFRAPEEQHVN